MTLPFASAKYHVIIWLVGAPLVVFLAVGVIHYLVP